MFANVRCLQTRWGGGGGVHAYAEGTQSRSTFFDTWTVTARGSKIQAESRGNIGDSASLRRKTICYHADTQTIYFMRMVAKNVNVLGRGIMRKERWMVFGHSLGRGYCDHAITFYGLSLPPTDTCSQDYCCFSKLLFKSTFLAFQ